MCEAASAIAIAGLALTAAATATSVYSAYEQNESQNKANDYNAAVMNRNAENSNAQATRVEEQGAIDEKVHRQKVQQMIGTQRAGFANTGLLVDDGTSLDVTKDTAGFGDLDAQTIRNNAAVQAWGVRNQSADYRAGANLATMRNSSGMLQAGGSLLAGGSQLVGQYSSAKQAGAFSGSGRPASIKAQQVYM